MILPSLSSDILSNDKKDSKFSVLYFSFHGLGACPRALLSIGGAQWDNKIQSKEDWPQIKGTTPLGTLPILLETSLSTGETIEIPESGAIERYLARKFGLLGDTVREQTLNDVFYAQAVMLNTKFAEKVVAFEEIRKKALDQFLETTLPDWIKLCEKHLAGNGNTGHFVDNKASLTLADIKTAVILDTFLGLESEKVLNPTASPGLWKLKETVDTHPGYATWRKSEGFKNIDKDTQATAGAIVPFDVSKAHIFS
ncbi:hypothetical protein BGZ80_006238 [Entomortierella chlamydospora]|uniref:Glutathione s-transferase n=1 Tax=Entomortierella chlamydospora TaxID=101097 RepID=A0A9P6N006_9FUNG|nr:hypothetical protein BGZ79_010736 [Entomortierella chlamydospora]KAG0019158.1 hypothetical protein BGZ80_006238 [Entomortierella chlamydospora]